MTFTYTGNLATDLDKLRFSIGDTSSASGAGVKPDGTNFTDEELNGLLAIEGSFRSAAASAFDTLAAGYARMVDITLGPRKEMLSQAAERYQKLAADWRKKASNSSVSMSVSISNPHRADSYENVSGAYTSPDGKP